jgi:hypothetical protein
MTKPRRWIGRWLLGVGILHTLLGLGTYIFSVVEIVRAGLWNTVASVQGRAEAVWFIAAGLQLILLGALALWIEARSPREPLPRFLGWTLLAFAVAGVVLMPVSVFWLLLPPAVGILARRGAPPPSAI